MAKKNRDTEATPKKRKKKGKLRMLFKWSRRISLIAAIVGGVRKYLTDQNEARPPTV